MLTNSVQLPVRYLCIFKVTSMIIQGVILYGFFSGISVGSSIFTITTMAVDRYMAIIKPFGLRYRCFNRKSTIIMITILWMFSLILFSPNLWIAGLAPIQGDITMCRMHYDNSPIPQKVIGMIWFVFMFAIPGKNRDCQRLQIIYLIYFLQVV